MLSDMWNVLWSQTRACLAWICTADGRVEVTCPGGFPVWTLLFEEDVFKDTLVRDLLVDIYLRML